MAARTGDAIVFSVITDGIVSLGNGAIAGALTISATGDISTLTGNITAVAGAVEAGSTVTAGTGITSTTGNIQAAAGAVFAGTSVTASAGNVVATVGDIQATAGAVSAGTTVTGGTGLIATTGDVTATAGDVVATAGDVLAAAGNVRGATLDNGGTTLNDWYVNATGHVHALRIGVGPAVGIPGADGQVDCTTSYVQQGVTGDISIARTGFVCNKSLQTSATLPVSINAAPMYCGIVHITGVGGGPANLLLPAAGDIAAIDYGLAADGYGGSILFVNQSGGGVAVVPDGGATATIVLDTWGGNVPNGQIASITWVWTTRPTAYDVFIR